MDRNKSHGIVRQEPVPFNSLMDLLAGIEKVLIAHRITLHVHRRMKKYFSTDESPREPCTGVVRVGAVRAG